MEYIVGSEAGAINYKRYLAYVETIRDSLPSHVYRLASSECYFNFQSHSSLHDAWLESVLVRELPTGTSGESRKLEITISLLGPFHDRRIHLLYTGVTCYCFKAPPKPATPRYNHKEHGDLFTHEIRLGHESQLIHELLFERNATFLIECSDIIHSEEIFALQTNDSNKPGT